MKKKLLVAFLIASLCMSMFTACSDDTTADTNNIETESDAQDNENDTESGNTEENIDDSEASDENEDIESDESSDDTEDSEDTGSSDNPDDSTSSDDSSNVDHSDSSSDTDNSDNASDTDSSDSASGTDNSDSSASQGSTTVAIVQVNGNVDSAKVTAVETSFTPIINALREKGMIGATDVCVTIDESAIKFDITPNNDTIDLALYTTDEANGIYTFALDQNLWYLEGFGELINGIDPAPYNKDAIHAMLGLISSQPAEIFNTIDQTYFSCYSLSVDEWTPIGDCQMMDGADSVPGAWSYLIKIGQ